MASERVRCRRILLLPLIVAFLIMYGIDIGITHLWKITKEI